MPPRALGSTPSQVAPVAGSEMPPVAGREGERADRERGEQHHLGARQHDRGAPAGHDRAAVDAGDGPDRGDRDDREPRQVQRHAEQRARERVALERAAGRDVQEDCEADRERGLRAGLVDREGGPAVQEAGQAAVGAAQEHVVAARLRDHRGDFGVGERAGERQQARREPDREHQQRAADVAGHDPRLQEDAGADHVRDVDRDRAPEAEAADELGAGGTSVGHRFLRTVGPARTGPPPYRFRRCRCGRPTAPSAGPASS